MIGPIIEEWFSGETLARNEFYSLCFREVPRTRKPFTGSWSVKIHALAVLRSTEIRFEEMSQTLEAALNRTTVGKLGRVACSWLVCSPSGGIYLYELLDTASNRKRGVTRNRFVVVNTCDGTVSFGPGDGRNRSFSDRMRDCIERFPVLPARSRARELSPILGLALELA